MSYALERFAINTFLRSQDNFGLAPFALDEELILLQARAGGVRITNGAGGQISTGAPGSNLHKYAGVASVIFYTDTKPEGIALADTIIAAFTGLKIDETGAAASAGASMTIDFTGGGVPSLAACVKETSFHRTTVFLPFTRTERK